MSSPVDRRSGKPLEPVTGNEAARRAVAAVWRQESAKIVAGVARLVRDLGLAEELAQDALVAEPALRRYPWAPAVRADLLLKLGRRAEAAAAFEQAVALTRNLRERALLLQRAAAASAAPPP